MQISEFKCLLEKALALMEKKLSKSNESIIKVFINEYDRVLDIINYDSKDILNGELPKIKMFTRMYMKHLLTTDRIFSMLWEMLKVQLKSISHRVFSLYVHKETLLSVQ